MVKCVSVNFEILKWAREKAGFSLEDVASIHKNVEVWETGEDFPTYKQLERLADKYKRPIALFFFPAPPEEKDLEKSFRTVPEYQISGLSPKIRFLLREAEVMQLNLYDLDEISSISKENITSALSVSYNANIKEVADNLRDILRISLKDQKNFKNIDIALDTYRTRLIEKGIFVFKEAFKNNDISGFCLYDEKFPVVYLNSSMPKTRQLFTLFHEVAHLLFKESDIDFIANKTLKALQAEYQKIEIFCNKFSAYFLVPDDDFEQYLNTEITETKISEISSLYKVSREVILRKFYDYGKVDNYLYKKWADKWKNERKKASKEGGGNPYFTRISYLGDKYVGTVLSNYYENKISKTQAGEFLKTKPKHFEVFENYFLNLRRTA